MTDRRHTPHPGGKRKKLPSRIKQDDGPLNFGDLSALLAVPTPRGMDDNAQIARMMDLLREVTRRIKRRNFLAARKLVLMQRWRLHRRPIQHSPASTGR